jgi:hypothetical protein
LFLLLFIFSPQMMSADISPCGGGGVISDMQTPESTISWCSSMVEFLSTTFCYSFPPAVGGRRLCWESCWPSCFVLTRGLGPAPVVETKCAVIITYQTINHPVHKYFTETLLLQFL